MTKFPDVDVNGTTLAYYTNYIPNGVYVNEPLLYTLTAKGVLVEFR